MTKRFVKTLAALAVIAAGGMAAQAATLFDQNLVSPDVPVANAAPWYNGTGNPNGGFTVGTGNGIELGLRAKLRQSGSVIDSPNNVYVVPNGAQIGVPNRAAWNYEFSIDLRPGASNPGLDGTLGHPATLADITATLTITDLTIAQTVTVNPLAYWVDDSSYGPLGRHAGTILSPFSLADWGAQNSENPNFADFPLAAFYDLTLTHNYQFDLNVYLGNTTAPAALLASDSIEVDVHAVPLPSAAWMGLAMVGLLGMAGMVRTKMRSVSL